MGRVPGIKATNLWSSKQHTLPSYYQANSSLSCSKSLGVSCHLTLDKDPKKLSLRERDCRTPQVSQWHMLAATGISHSIYSQPFSRGLAKNVAVE